MAAKQPSSASAWRRYAANIAAVLFGFVIVFAVIEAPFRILYYVTDRTVGETEASWVYLPYVGYFRAPNEVDRNGNKADAQGFLVNHTGERRNLAIKGPSEFRVFIVGGSTVAHGSSDAGDTISALLEDRLRGLFKKAGISRIPRVVNAGIDGYYSAQELLLFNFFLLPLKPDYVIFFDGSNDFLVWGDVDKPAFRLLKNNYHDYQAKLFQQFNQLDSLGGALAPLFRQLANHSAALDFLYKLVAHPDRFRRIVSSHLGDRENDDAVLKRYLPRHVERYFRNIRSTIGVGLAQGIPIAYFLQPTILGDSGLSEKELGFKRSLRTRWHGISYFKAKQLFYSRVQDGFMKLHVEQTGQRGVTIGDLSGLFDDKSVDTTYYIDHVHYNAIGRRRISEALFDTLGEAILSTAREQMSRTAK